VQPAFAYSPQRQKRTQMSRAIVSATPGIALSLFPELERSCSWRSTQGIRNMSGNGGTPIIVVTEHVGYD
jgi:hypothetical protein